MDMKEKVAIIIVLYNPSNEDKQNILNISTFSEGIIVDNSPKPSFNTQNVNSLFYCWLKENKGIAYAQNYGINHIIKEGKYSYIMFLDQDSRINKNYIYGMALEYQHLSTIKKNLALLGPLVINQDNQKEYKSLAKSNLADENGFITKRNIISSGSCISCNLIEKIGMPNAKLFIDYVDSEWCWRANQLGYICGQTSKFRLLHHIGIKTIKIGNMQDIISSPTRYYYQYRNYLWLLRIRYVPKMWKIKNAIRLICRPFYLPIYSKSINTCYKHMFKGIFDGITKFKKFKTHD